MTFQSEGELTFKKSNSPYRTNPLPEIMLERRKNQLDNIEFLMKMELVKNLSMHKILGLCSLDDGEVSSYLELEAAIANLEFDQIIDALMKD